MIGKFAATSMGGRFVIRKPTYVLTIMNDRNGLTSALELMGFWLPSNFWMSASSRPIRALWNTTALSPESDLARGRCILGRFVTVWPGLPLSVQVFGSHPGGQDI